MRIESRQKAPSMEELAAPPAPVDEERTVRTLSSVTRRRFDRGRFACFVGIKEALMFNDRSKLRKAFSGGLPSSDLVLRERDGFIEVNFPEPHRSRCLDIL